MKQIALKGKLGKGLFTLVDDEDYEWLNKYVWYLGGRYVRGAYTKSDRQSKFMHKLITGYKQTDHKDCDRLNNQRHNLREATDCENQRNKNKSKKRKYASKYKGVGKHGDKFFAFIRIDGKTKHLGIFLTEDDAGKQYDIMAIKVFGEFANTNFDKELYTKDIMPVRIDIRGVSKYRHISWDQKNNKWKVQIKTSPKKYEWLGRFSTEDEAINAIQDYYTDLYYELLDEQTTIQTNQSEDNTKGATKCSGK